jgi:hypothetical protein
MCCRLKDALGVPDFPQCQALAEVAWQGNAAAVDPALTDGVMIRA